VLLPLTPVLTWRTQSHQLCGISCDSGDFLSTPTAPAAMKTHHTTSELLMYTTAKPLYTACETVKQETVRKEMNWGKRLSFEAFLQNSEQWSEVMLHGRLFKRWLPTTRNAQQPTVETVYVGRQAARMTTTGDSDDAEWVYTLQMWWTDDWWADVSLWWPDHAKSIILMTDHSQTAARSCHII